MVKFATSNAHKVEEGRIIAKYFGVEIEKVDCPYPEIQSEELSNVAETGVRYVFDKIREPVIVEDSGLFIQALDEFPGAYSAFVFGKLGNYGLLKLLEDTDNRKAEFRSCIGYHDGVKVETFEGVCEGEITEAPCGQRGFGYDPVFKPDGHDKTFGEDPVRKDAVSHRRKSFDSFLTYLTQEKSR